MSSSRHSVRSTRSIKPAHWRTISTPKKSPSATLSYVFAEPEQGSPLASAVSKLPTILPINDNDTASIRSFMKPSEHPGAAETMSSGERQADTSSMTDGCIDPKPSEQPPTSTEPVQQVVEPTVSTESPPVPPSSSPSQTDSRSSWFGTISRKKRRTSLAEPMKPPSQQPEPVQAPALPVIQEPPTSSTLELQPTVPLPEIQVQPPPPFEPEPARVHESVSMQSLRSSPRKIPSKARRSWFSSAPSTPPQRLPPPIASQNVEEPSEPLPPPRNEPIQSPPMSTSAPVSVKVTPPNPPTPTKTVPPPANLPSSTRFTLGIPLLGKPKVPLEQVLPNTANPPPKSNAKTEPPQTTQTTTPTPEPTSSTSKPLSSSSPTTTTSSSQDEPPTITVEPPASDDENRAMVPSSSSWWGYVGWSSAPQPPSPPSEKSDEPQPPANPDNAASPPVITSTNPTVQGSSPIEKSEAQIQPTTAASNTISDTEINKISLATVSSDGESSSAQGEGSQNQGYVWYSPWAWVGSDSGPLPAGEASGVVDTPPTNGKVDGNAKVEEGLVQDRQTADAAGVTTEPTASTDPSTVAPAQEGPNPIGLTIETNRSGWASFFTSRTLVAKSIAAGGGDVPRDENGMETMNIDSDDESSRSVRVREIHHPIPISVASSTSSTCSEKSYVKVKRGRLLELSPPTPPKKTRVDGNTEKALIPPIVISESLRRETAVKEDSGSKRTKSASPAPSKKSGTETPVRPPIPNLVLPTWVDTFHAAPRNVIPPPPQSKLTKTMKFVSEVLFAKDAPSSLGKGREDHVNDVRFTHFGKELPKAWDVVEGSANLDVLRGCQNVVVIGIHGWFPGVVMRTVLGEPTGTSAKFVNMMVQAIEEFQEKHDVQLKKITKIPLEGEGTINRRVDKLYTNMLANEEWMEDLHAADAIFVATHSQGSVVSTHLLDRLIRDQHIKTSRNVMPGDPVDPLAAVGASVMPSPKIQHICCLALCGIHLGPLRYLRSSSLVQPYIQYFESTAARELFEFQNTESQVSREYIEALGNVLDHGAKMLYIASLNDQVVPLYSGLFMAASHPLILRALYIDGDAYHSSDFLSNLFVLLLRIVNSGVSDRGLFAHLSEATAGSLNGVGHSTAYEELETYSLAVRYLFLSNSGLDEKPPLSIEPYNALNEQNDYEIPWLLRDLIADSRVTHFFSREISDLRDAFRDWHPKTAILRDIKRKLQPIQRLPSSFSTTSTATLASTTTTTSKL